MYSKAGELHRVLSVLHISDRDSTTSVSPHLSNPFLCTHLPILTTLPSIHVEPSAAHNTATQYITIPGTLAYVPSPNYCHLNGSSTCSYSIHVTSWWTAYIPNERCPRY